ncbi:chemotaxis protein CheA [Cycloclasticus sp. 46_120_T64]|nr:chemotaxis protein CheA [Cycloclasticus sp. 46_120_T64]
MTGIDLGPALIIFTQEAKDLLEEMESSLLSLEDEPDDSETVNSVFRAMHTIKGSAGLFGFNPVVSFTHEAETVLDHVRNGERDIDAALISVLLDCKDHTAVLLEFCLESPDAELTDELSAAGDELVKQLGGNETASEIQTVDDVNEGNASIDSEGDAKDIADSWLISLAFKSDAFRMGVDPLSFFRYLKTLGQIQRVLLITSDIPEGDEFDPESCYIHCKLAFKSDADKQTIEDVFEFAADDCDINILPPNSKIETYYSLLDDLSESHIQRLGDILVEVGALTQNDIDKAIQTQADGELRADQDKKPLGEILVEQQVVQAAVVDKALEKQQQVKQKAAAEASFIRVDSNKLGQLIDLVGELVISGAAMDLMVGKHGLADVEEVAETMNSLVSGIRDTALDLRMVPIGETFSRFRRVVRDVSKDLGKNIELKISGGETELDKTVVEKINDPLTHLIRNSLDHGIETPEQRLQAGKSEKGHIKLTARHQSGHVIIQIIDDGAGLNKERIVAKAVANGIVEENHNLTDQEIYNLIFAAGLSTKDEASDLSGRGVGMDVVRRNIEALRGSVNIDSRPGEGATITIQLPLTLAIIDGFMVEASNERYIIPLSMVEECVEMNGDNWQVDEVQNYVNLRGVAMPYLRLAEYFNAAKVESNNKKKVRQSLVVVRLGKNKAGFVVDELHGEHQTVIKPLGKIFENLDGLTGATVLGDGNVALILDVQGLIKAATT